MTIYSYGKVNRPSNKKFMNRDYKPDNAKQIRTLLLQGMSVTDIAEYIGLSKGRVGDIMAQHGMRKPCK